jgi:hypothetical protein
MLVSSQGVEKGNGESIVALDIFDGTFVKSLVPTLCGDLTFSLTWPEI